MTSEENPITMSPLCQEITREGQTIDVLIYDDGAAGWLLEVVDVHGTSLVWDDSFATDQEALDEVFAALDDEGMQGLFAGDHDDSTLAVNEDRALLETFLSEQNNSAALTYFQTCGFLFAVSCCPELIPPSEWMPLITGGDPTIDKGNDAKIALDALITLYNQINEEIAAKAVDLPKDLHLAANILDNFGSTAALGQWSDGFVKGTSWLLDIWDEYLPKSFVDEHAAQVYVLSLFANYELSLQIHQESSTQEKSLEEFAEGVLAKGLFHDAMQSYAHIGRSISEALEQIDTARSQIYTRAKKIGRNEVCPCGSGKKYKKCCLGKDDMTE